LLFETLKGQERDRVELGLELCRQWIRLGQEDAARPLLKSLQKSAPEHKTPPRWLAALDAPRLGRLALVGGGSRADDSGTVRLRRAAVFLETMQPATVHTAGSDTEAVTEQQALIALLQSFSAPQVVPLLQSGEDASGHPYYAVLRPGQRLSFLMERRRGPSMETVLRACAEAASILACLARLGVSLPDADPRRFELDDDSRLWLSDLSGATRTSVDENEAAHGQSIARFCSELFGMAARLLPPSGLISDLESCSSATRAAQVLQRQLLSPLV
jgi:hypothetical protein